jgi:hypothetical protein
MRIRIFTFDLCCLYSCKREQAAKKLTKVIGGEFILLHTDGI